MSATEVAINRQLSRCFVDIAKLALPAASAQAVQVILMVFLSRSAGSLGTTYLAANGLSEIVIVVAAIQPLIAFGLGLAAVVSHKIGKQQREEQQQRGDDEHHERNEDDDEQQQQHQDKRHLIGSNNSNAAKRWQDSDTMTEPVHTFWTAALLTVAFSVFVCTPVAVIGGPLLLKTASVDSVIVGLTLKQLFFTLVPYPLLFAVYFVLAQLCVIDKRTDLLMWASAPVVFLSIPVLSFVFGQLLPSTSSATIAPRKQQQQHAFDAANSNNLLAPFHALGFGWLAAMATELAVIVILCIRYNLIPPFGRYVDRSSGERTLPWFSYVRRLLSVDTARLFTVLADWLLPSLAVFLSGHTAFELGFVVGSSDAAMPPAPPQSADGETLSSSPASTAASCTAATLVVAHQVRFALTLIPHGIVTALNSLFSREVGARRHSNAAVVFGASLLSVVVVTVVEGLFVVLVRDWVPGFFHSSDECVKREFDELVLPLAFALVFEYVVWCCVTALRVLGQNRTSVIVSFTGWWCLTLPAITVFALLQHRGAASVFDGALVGQATIMAPAVYLTYHAFVAAFPSAANLYGSGGAVASSRRFLHTV